MTPRTRPSIAIAGGISPDRAYDPPLREPSVARLAAEQLGAELAKQGCRLIVYSSAPNFVESDVVHGYVASGLASPGSVQVRGRHGHSDAGFAEVSEHPEVFDVRPEASADWEVAYYRSLIAADGLLLAGGGRSTFTAGLIALSTCKPLLTLAMFGGSAEKVWQIFSRERNQATESELSAMADRWQSHSAATLVTALLAQRQRAYDELQASLRLKQGQARRTWGGLLISALMLVLALAAIPLTFAFPIGTVEPVLILTAAPVLAATCGALIRNVSDESGEWLRAAVLGATAGAISAILFTGGQLVASPEILMYGGAQRLIFFVLPIGFVAGLTFDAVYAKLRAQDVVNTPPLSSAEAVPPGS